MFDIGHDRKSDLGGAGGRRERHKRDKRLRILRSARDLFSEKGFARTTIREVATRADVGTGTLFSYARDKRDLLHQVFRAHIGGVQQTAFETIPDTGTVQEKLMHVFRAFFASYAENVPLARDFMRERFHMILDDSDGQPASAAQTLAFLQALAALLEAAQQAGELRDDFPPLLAASSIFAVYLLAVDTWLGSPLPMDRQMVEGLLADTIALHIDGLRPRARKVGTKSRQ